jgi:membrane-associated phospholipid phosphatase
MNISKMIDHIGFNGPILLFVLSAILLRNKRRTMFIYIVGSIINVLINYFLKMTIKEPRPIEDNIELEWINMRNKREDVDKYGMPSGHAQMVWFSTVFVFCVLKDYTWLFLFLLISLNTVFQRFHYNNHTLTQLLIGSIIGMLFGYILFKQI